MELPSEVVRAQWDLQVTETLGGRANRHWLVGRRGEAMVLRRWSSPPDDIAYELHLMARLAGLGWPVARHLDGPLPADGHVWSLLSFLPGAPPSQDDPEVEGRARGRLLARLHADTAQITDLGQRGGWRRCEEIVADGSLDATLMASETTCPEGVRILRWHLDRARERLAEIGPLTRPPILVHGDFAPWNLRFTHGQLTGLLDFELAHQDHRVADFALSWRGKYDAVVEGYAEVTPLLPEEWALLTPLWWITLIDGACRDLAHGTPDDGWTIRKLLLRSPLMGPDAAGFP